MAQYDSRQLELAREQEEVLNNQQRLFEIQMEELRDGFEERIQNLTSNYESRIAELEQYQAEFERTIRRRHANEIARLREEHDQQTRELILRFNPQIRAGRVANALRRNFSPEIRGKSDIEPYRALLGDEGAISRREYADLAENVASIMSAHQLPPEAIELEITENTIIKDWESFSPALE